MSVASDTDIVTRAKELLDSLEYVNVASVTADGMPWNTPVYAPWDEQLIFYWGSWQEAEHSKNIRANPNVFLTLYDSTRLRGTNNLRCLYFQAKAFELADPGEIARASSLLYGTEGAPDLSIFSGNSVKRLYKAVSLRAWLNDTSEREVTPETVKMRVELPLQELKVLCQRYNKTN